jgi:CubicO group peptidase (beta-lactamase class C family)
MNDCGMDQPDGHSLDGERGAAVMREFLSRSPRTAVDVRVVLGDHNWTWQHGKAAGVASPVFEIGSVGKTLTTTLLALLVERRQVALTDPVSRYLPGLDWGDKVTLQQLASHTSGLPGNPFSRWQLMRRGRQLAESFPEDGLMQFLRRLPKVRPAGNRARYSNIGMALLGRILGGVCGQSYGGAVEDLILRPLGMRDTRLDPVSYEAARLMEGHDSRGRPVPPFIWRGMEAAGLWRSTCEDMTRFLRAQTGAFGSPWDALVKVTTLHRGRISRDTQIGLGWMLSGMRPFGSCVWHGGGTFGQHSMVACWPQSSTTVVVLTDRMPPWWHHLLPSRQLERIPGRLLSALTSG